MTNSSYRRAGVDIDAKYASVTAAKEAIRATFTPGVLSDIGLFGGLFDLGAAGASGEVLVASTDGVGTKVKIAGMMRRYDTVGQCIVNHCVNDILVQGARPLFFLDYIGTGRMDPGMVSQLLTGVAVACRQAGCALLGGETAEMPGMYPDGEFEIVGTIVGSVPRERLLDGSRVREGDVIVSLPSNGLHTNGYSLARKVLFEDRGYRVEDQRPGLGTTIGEALLAVHTSYLGSVLPVLMESDAVHACAHITGGGLYDNLPRVLPKGLCATVHKDSLPVPPIFRLIVDEGGVAEREAYRVFNMGFGFLLLVDPDRVGGVMDRLRQLGQTPAESGVIEAGGSGVQVV